MADPTPPSPKQKARFTDLASKIRSLTMLVWPLKNPNAAARSGMSGERVREKPGRCRPLMSELQAKQLASIAACAWPL